MLVHLWRPQSSGLSVLLKFHRRQYIESLMTFSRVTTFFMTCDILYCDIQFHLKGRWAQYTTKVKDTKLTICLHVDVYTISRRLPYDLCPSQGFFPVKGQFFLVTAACWGVWPCISINHLETIFIITDAIQIKLESTEWTPNCSQLWLHQHSRSVGPYSTAAFEISPPLHSSLFHPLILFSSGSCQ